MRGTQRGADPFPVRTRGMHDPHKQLLPKIKRKQDWDQIVQHMNRTDPMRKITDKLSGMLILWSNT
jgi:hypothetical protein